jgi:hypothetical protein
MHRDMTERHQRDPQKAEQFERPQRAVLVVQLRRETMRSQIIDTIRSVSIESDVLVLPGREITVWSVVTRCPVNGIWAGEMYETRAEAQAELDAMFAN